MISGLSFLLLALVLHGGRVCTRKLEALVLVRLEDEGQVEL
jgi:hypothetical protein